MRFTDKKYIDAIENVYLGDPIFQLQSIFQESEQFEVANRLDEVTKQVEPIAKIYDIPAEMAYFMVWMTDSGLCFDESVYESILKKFNYEREFMIKMPQFEKDNKYYLHGRISEIMCNQMFSVGSDQVLRAIAYHETLYPNIEHSNYEKMIFVADKLVPKFSNSSHVDIVSKGLAISINTAIKDYLEWYIENAETLGEKIHPYIPQVLTQYRDFSRTN